MGEAVEPASRGGAVYVELLLGCWPDTCIYARRAARATTTKDKTIAIFLTGIHCIY
ncbi:MAG: hypothetical protein QXW41_03610 [Fervidicoccaceae archaeon]